VEIEESKTAFFCLRLFFGIDTFQRVRGDANKKFSTLWLRPKSPVRLPPGAGLSVVRNDQWYSTGFLFLPTQCTALIALAVRRWPIQGIQKWMILSVMAGRIEG
jgi:hypothetical protein